MQDYDVTLKSLLQTPGGGFLQRLTGAAVEHWMNIELPRVQTGRVDLLGRMAAGGLLHAELQSANDFQMALRMAEYLLWIYRQFGQFARQIVLYVGDAELRMATELKGPSYASSYTLIDIREINASELFASPRVDENVLAILARFENRPAGIRRILGKIATLEAAEREQAFSRLLILAGLRKLEKAVRDEAKTMPILNSILDHEVIGPAIQQGIEQGGSHIIRRQLESRFGKLPDWAELRLAALSAGDLDEIAVRVLSAKTLPDVFQQQ